VVQEIDIWRVAVLMVNRYADAEANADRHADELRPKGESSALCAEGLKRRAIKLVRRSGVIGSGY
jgi:hypothetical protein